MKIGNNIKECRNIRKITQQQLAEMIGKSLNTIKKYESGYTLPPINVINDIAEALMVSTSDLIPANEKDIKIWDKEITPQIYLSQISTEELIEELNRRDDFPIKIDLKH